MATDKQWNYLPSLGGLETIKPVDKISDNKATECRNIDMSNEGFIQSSRGYTLVANESSGGKCMKGFLYRKALGTLKNILLKNTEDGSNSQVYWLNPDNSATSDGKWELLLGNLTSNAVMGFANANGDKNTYQNRIIMCNGEEPFTIWNGATGLVDSVTSSTITIKENIQSEGFNLDSGTLMVDGVQYTYSGTSGSIFSGVNPDPTIQNPVENSGVAQKPDDVSFAESTYTADTISFNSSTGEITDSASGFGSLGSPNTIRISGADKFENNYIFPVESITNSKITVDTTNFPIVDESAGKTITIFAGNPKGNILLMDQGKLFLSNGKDNKIFYSRSQDATTFSPTGGNIGSAGFFVLMENSGNITAISSTNKQNTILIHKENGITSYARVSEGTETRESTQNLADGEGSGAINQKAITRYNQAAYIVTKVNGLNSLSKAINDTSLNIDSFSENILPIIQQFDFSNSSIIYFPDKRCLYVSCKDEDGKDKMLSFYLRKNASNQWVTDISIDDFALNDFVVYNNTLYGFSSLNQNVYKMYNSKSKNGTSIKHRWASKEFTIQYPANTKEVDTFFVEGFIGNGTKLKISMFYGAYGLDGSMSKIISYNDDKPYMYEHPIKALGYDALGIIPIGTRSSDILDSYFFSIPIAFPELRTNRMKIVVETYYDDDTLADSYWGIVNMGFHSTIKHVDQIKLSNINN